MSDFDINSGYGTTEIECPLCDDKVTVDLTASGRRYANHQLMVGVRVTAFEDHFAACIDRELDGPADGDKGAVA